MFDECTDPDLIDAILRTEPLVDIVRVGWEDAPPERIKDPELLIAAEETARVLVSNDKKSLPGHLANHFASGRHTHGVILMRRGFSIGTLAEELLIVWTASEAEEWIDGWLYIPY
ncbi:MAG: hypothetical protein AB7K24_20535 [Gemmataceae bacterium]